MLKVFGPMHQIMEGVWARVSLQVKAYDTACVSGMCDNEVGNY